MAAVPRFVKVASADELASGEMLTVEVEGRELVLVNLDGQFFALDNQCPHMGGPLGRGRVEQGTIVCPWHAWQWDPKSGRAVSPPVDWRALTYPVRVEDGDVLVRVA